MILIGKLIMRLIDNGLRTENTLITNAPLKEAALEVGRQFSKYYKNLSE